VALVEGHLGRWLLTTLTVDRQAWLSPEMAYQRCNERVRQVARRVSKLGIHVTAFEVQSKTGDGWPHWHLIIYAPDDRPLPAIRAEVRRAWQIIEERTEVDEATGEVLSVSRTRQSIGFSDVQEARTREGIARYVAKYLMKAWPAIPAWMGEGKRQLRKLRISVGAFAWLTAQGRHRPKLGGRRKPAKPGRCSRRRPLFDRMAASSNSMSLMQRQGDRLVFRRQVPIAASGESVLMLEALGAEPLGDRSVPLVRTRWLVPSAGVGDLSAGVLRELAAKVAAERFKRRRAEFARAWAAMQSRGGEPSPGLSPSATLAAVADG
jgi:hypothetical protein